MIITSVNNEKIKRLVRLKDKKYRDMIRLFFIEGIDIIDEAYKNGLLKEIYIIEGYDNPYKDIECTYISREVMKKISDMDSISNYYGVCSYIEEKELGDRVLILDGIQDPGNLGTIIRSGVAFGFNSIILSRECVSIYNPKVLRSTKGMIFNINIIVRDIEEYIKDMEDYYIYGTDVIEGIDVRDIKIDNKKIGIVIGNEGRGISNRVREYCDKFIYIDMDKKCESLNAGVAASILMYEVSRK